MYDDLFDLMVEGAFANKEEFDSFVNESSPEEIYSLVSEGAFADIDEFKSMYSSGAPVVDVIDNEVKKKDETEPNPFSLSTEQEIPNTPESMSASSVSVPTLASQEVEPDPQLESVQDAFVPDLLNEDTNLDPFEQSLENVINSDLIGDTEEEVLPQMVNYFSGYGFSFSKADVLGDGMTVKAENGDELYVNLDRWWSKESTSKELKDFLRNNRVENEAILSQADIYVDNQQKIYEEKEILKAVKSLDAQTEDFSNRVKKYALYKDNLDRFYKQKLSNVTREDLARDEVLRANYEQWNKANQQATEMLSNLRAEDENFQLQGQRLDVMAAEYTEMRQQMGSYTGGIYNAFLDGVARISSGAMNAMVDASTYALPNRGMGEKSYIEEIARVALSNGSFEEGKFRETYDEDKIKDGMIEVMDPELGTPKMVSIDVLPSVYDLSKEELIKELGGDTNDMKFVAEKLGQTAIASRIGTAAYNIPLADESEFDKANAKVMDIARKGMKYEEGYNQAKEKDIAGGRYRNPYSSTAQNTDTSLGMLDATRRGMRFVYGSEGTTKEWSDLEKQSFWGGAILGLSESLPAMIGGNNPVGWAQRTAQMYAQVTDHVTEEMEKDPSFDMISENEKQAVNIPIGIAVATLESIGLRNVLSQKGLLNSVIAKAVARGSKKTTGKSFGNFIREDVQNRIARGTLVVTGAGLAEYETGAAQEAAEITIKNIYNDVKGKEMFTTPDTWQDWVKQVNRAGAQEAVGGFILGAPTAVSVAVKGLQLQTLDDRVFKMFEEVSKDENYMKMYTTKLKQKIAESTDPKTKKEAQEELALVKQLQGALEQIPSDYTTQQKKEAVQLIFQKNSLENEINAEDKILSKPKQDLLNKVNDRLAGIVNEASVSQQESKANEQNIPDLNTGNIVDESETEQPGDVTVEEQTDIDNFFNEDNSSSETKAQNLAINRSENVGEQNQNPFRNSVVKIAEMGAKALSKILPNVKIVMHETNEQYLKYAKLGDGRAEYNPDNTTIHINLSKATKTTVPHEIFHAVLMEKVKSDPAIARAAEQMVLSVQKLVPKDSDLGKRIEAFAAGYKGSEFQNEERLAELVGILSSEYRQLDRPSKNIVVEFLKGIAKKFGIEIGNDFGAKDADVIDLLNVISRKTRTGEVITEADVKTLEELDNGTNPIGSPTTIVKPSGKQQLDEIVFKDTYKNSLVNQEKKVDVDALIDEIVEKDQKVWFWVADQLGIDEEMGIDGGPSFAHQNPNDIWASSMSVKGIENNISKTDYLFVISGSPTVSKLFNKSAYDFLTSKLGDFNTFKAKALEAKPIKVIKETLENYDSWQELRETTDRKPFLIALNNSQNTPNTKFTQYVESINGYTDLNTMRDGFYAENGFEQNDIMLILKPTGVRAGSNHSTYENTVEGEVIGVPNRKVNALDIMPEAMKAKYTESSRSQASQAIAPYGSGRRSVSKRTKTTDTKSKPKVRQQKSIEEIARYYNMNTSGFLPNQVDLYRLKKLLPPGFGVKQSKFDSYGRGGSYYIVNARGYKVNPYKNKGRQQKDIEDYIVEARKNNFKENQIKDYLVRAKKFPVKLVDSLMKVDANMFEALPKSFGNIKGGIKAGIKLYNKIEKFRAKETKLNGKRKNKLTEQQIVDKTIQFLESQPEYIAESEFYTVGSKKKGTQQTKRRTGISLLQAQMLSDIQKNIDIRPTQNMGMKIAAARLFLRQAKKGQLSLKELQSQVRNLIRKTLPKELYESKDVLRLINTVNETNEDSIENTLQEVVNFVIETNVKSLEKKIGDILNDKYQEVDKNNKLKPKKIVDEIKKRIDFIKSNILGRKSTKEQIGDANLELLTRFNELMDIQQQTEEEQTEMVDIQLAMQYNNAMLMDNDNPNKVTELDGINMTLVEMIKFGRSLLKDELLRQHQYYNEQFTNGYEAITGDRVDMSDPDAKTQLNNRKKQRAADEKRKALTQNVIKKFFSGMFTKISNYTFGTAEAMDGLMMRIDKLPGEMFGGRLNEMFTDRVDESSRRFKGRMLEVEAILAGYLYETLGKNWKKISRKNRMQIDLGIELHDGIMLEPLSQDQIAYFYNMYKDPANRASFSNPKMWGVEIINKDDTAAEKKRKQKANEANAKRIMGELETQLDPKVKDIADWQVDVLYPALYAEYNKTYKKLYRTDLPWNKFYGGTIYRDGVTEQETDVFNALGQGNMYKTAVGANATKVRQRSNLPIKAMNQMDLLNTYINDMEYFAAYGETIRDMDKFFSNEYVKSAIKEIHGSEINTFIKDMITKVAQQGQHSGMKAKVINGMNNVFILSRLALSPVITLKQLTSTFTYANDIGPLNWLKYAAKNKTEQLKVWKEVTENSVYMKDRNSTSIMRAIETYTDAKMKEFVPRPTKDFLINFMMYTTKIGDRGAIMLGGLPNYSYYKANAIKDGKTEEEAIQIAIRKFERDTKRTQQSGDLQDKDYLQTGEPITRAMNMFLTTPKQYLRKEIIATRELYRKLAAWDRKAGKGTVAQNLRTFGMYHIFMPVLFQYVAMGLPGILRGFRDDDDEDLLRAAVIGNLNALFIIGELVQTAGDALTNKPWAGSQAKTVGLIQIANGITRDFIKAANYKDPEKKAKAYRDAYFELSTLTGLPMPTIAKFFDGYSKLDSEPEIGKMIMRLLNYSNYQIEGPNKKSSSSNKSGSDAYQKNLDKLQREYEKEQKQNTFKKSGYNDSGFGDSGFEDKGFGDSGYD